MKYFTIKEAAKRAGLSLSSVYDYIKIININPKKEKGKIVLSSDDIKKIKYHKIRKSGTQISKIKNKTISINSRTGIRGVFFVNKTKKYRAFIQVKGEIHIIGEYSKIENAKEARIEAEKKYFDPVIKIWEKGIKSVESVIGQHFDRLTVIEKTTEKEGRNILYKCVCECGNVILTRLDGLKSGVVVSCGCKKKENLKPAKETEKYFNGTCINMIENDTLWKNNTSGKRGVTWLARTKKWEAYIYLRGKRIRLGTYQNFSDAVEARLKGETAYFQPVIDEYNSIKHQGLAR